MSTRPPHQYRDLEPEQQESLLSNFLVNSWSYSKVSSFARNQLAFEMQYIFGIYGKSGPTTIAGNAYHSALQVYFTQMMDGVHVQLPELDACAFQYLEQVPANRWKLGKTTPTMEKAMEAALKTANNLLKNFYAERYTYEDDIAEVLAVELYTSEWLTINGVDIPLPCNSAIDLVVRTKKGKIAIVDHKSKTVYTDEKEASLAIGPQAIIYALAYEAKTGTKVDEVRFMENKPSENKDKTAQIKPIKVELDDNTRRLYELLLYGNLKPMISAVKDPDHVYTVNLSDNFVDMAELLDFWSRVQICEVEDFNVEESKKELLAKRLKKVKDANVQMIPPSVIKAFREKAATFIQYDYSVLNMSQPQVIEHVLRQFNIISKVEHTFEGYSSNTFLLKLDAGTRIDGIRKYRLDIANGLGVENVRISNQLVVHEGKSYLSIDLSKKADKVLSFNSNDRQGWKIPLGKDNFGNIIVWDMDNPSTPHAIICGQTRSGKSVEIFNIIEHVQAAGADQIVILDPKFEFEEYRSAHINVLNEIEQIEWTMHKLVQHMNKLIYERRKERIIVIFDEFADAFANSRKGKALEGEKSLEENLRLLAQKGASCGIRLCIATQRASVKVVTGDTKVNFPVQICFRVNKEADSRVILDEAGAECLAGKGDGLIKSPEYSGTIRFQAYYKPQHQTA